MRSFASNGYITCSAGAVPQTSANISIAAILRTGANFSGYRMLFNIDDGTNGWGFGTSSTSKFSFYQGANGAPTTTISVSTFYCAGVSKASGTTIPRYHWVDYAGNPWIHENGAASQADNAAPTSPSVRLGSRRGVDTFWTADGAALVAVWNRVLTDAEFELLPFTLSYWLASQPKALWLLDQAATTQNVIDATGNGANQSAISGTSISANSVPVFSYGAPLPRVQIQPAAAGGGGANSSRDLLLLGAG